MALKTTPLTHFHRRQGARLVDFSGWEMPLHYGSQIEEHHRVRRDAGVFDVSHMLAIDLEGAGAEALLRRLLSKDVGRLARPGAALYALMLNEDGGIVDDVIAYQRGPAAFRVVVNAGPAEKDLAWIRRHGAGLSVTMTPRRDLAILAVQGPNARRRAAEALPAAAALLQGLARFQAAEADGAFVARTGYTGEDGCELMLPAERAEGVWRRLLDAGVAPCGLGARDTLRLEAGLNLYGQDMDEDVTPFECGLGWAVDLDGTRDFVGRAALAGARPRWQRLGLVLEDKGVLRHGQRVETAAGEGLVTSGGFAPTLGRSIALARVPLGVAPGASVNVAIRDKMAQAKCVQPPFVREGKPCIPLLSGGDSARSIRNNP
ncbi:MAG: glycine cleavage system aminomethyltransferase GcvT [Pseudomonadota bacterium]